MSRWKLKVAEGLLKGHTNPRTHIFRLGITQQQDCQLWGPNKKIAYIFVSLSGTGMHKIKNLGSVVLDAQGSRQHEGEWPYKPGSQYQTWHITLTPF
jgi:hypothetical protein